jgi:ABC-type lipoprotein release transport system permease subunit
MLYGVSPLDFVAWMLSGLVMLVAALLATLVPARRAARADPVVAMQIE